MLKENKDVQKQFENMLSNDNNLYSIPPLVYYEVKRGLCVKKANVKLNKLKELYENSIAGEMNSRIWEKAVDIYTKLTVNGKLIGDGDIFIASFCIVNDYILVTNNTAHYGRIDELKMVNWKSQ